MDIKKQKLNDLVVTVELTLMSVIQGVALYFLADNTRIAVQALDYEHWIYIPITFMFLIVFWSQALVHIISFISWPIELIHNFLYFLVVITEVLMFTNITNPLFWFATNIVFFFVVGLLYYADFSLMKKKKIEFENSPIRKQFYTDILRDQKIGMYFLVPSGMLFGILSCYLITVYPDLFLLQHFHIALAVIQAVIGLVSLFYLVRTFKQRFITIEEI